MRCAVVGSPIGHSLSPAMHRAAYAELGLDWNYDRIEVASGHLAEFVEGLDDTWRGLSVTMPLKREAAAIATRASEDVLRSKVANTLVRNDDGWVGFNTDITGAVTALGGIGVEHPSSVRILGAGATAVSILEALAQLGSGPVTVALRDPSRASAVLTAADRLGLELDIESLGVDAVDATELLVSTVPAVALAGREDAYVTSAAAVFDVIYDPWPTPLVEAARIAGRPVATGLDLLAAQAAVQIKMMTGRDIGTDVLVEAALYALQAR